MFYNKIFRQPYLNTPDDLGGGNETPPATEPINEPAQEPTTSPNGGKDPEPEPQLPKIKVKYNHQEMELPYEEAVQHIQKGMNYEKAIEKAKAEAAQQARDAYIASQGYVWNDKPITTEAEYNQAMKEKEIWEKYQSQGLPDEVVQELVESKKFREQFESEKKSKAEQEKKNAEYQEFFEYFKAENGRDFNSATDTIPQDVWDLVAKGKTLTDAYTYNLNKQLKAKIAELESKQKAIETNRENANSTPGSVTGNGTTTVDFISFETFEAKKSDPNWVKKNLSKIVESRAKW